MKWFRVYSEIKDSNLHRFIDALTELAKQIEA